MKQKPKGQADLKQPGKAAGAQAWLVEPFNPPQLLDVVIKFIPEGNIW